MEELNETLMPKESDKYLKKSTTFDELKSSKSPLRWGLLFGGIVSVYGIIKLLQIKRNRKKEVVVDEKTEKDVEEFFDRFKDE